MPEFIPPTLGTLEGPPVIIPPADAAEGVKQAVLNLPAGAVSNVLVAPGKEGTVAPGPVLDPASQGQEIVAQQLLHSGAALRAYDFVAGLPTALMNAARGVGYQANTEQQAGPGGAAVNVPTAPIHYPGQEQVESEIDAIKQRSRGLMPYNIPKPTTVGGEIGSEVGHSIGSWILPTPSAPYEAAAAIPGIGKVLKHAAEIVLPPAKAAAVLAPVGGALTAAGELSSYLENPDQYLAHVTGTAKQSPEQTATPNQPQSSDVAPIAQPTPGTQGPAQTPPPAPDAPATPAATSTAEPQVIDAYAQKFDQQALTPVNAGAQPIHAGTAPINVVDTYATDMPTTQAAPATPRGYGTARVGGDWQSRGQAIHDEFTRLGYPDHVAWGLAANALHESSGDPNTRPGDRGASHGLFQWNGPRLREFQQMYGHDPAQGTLREAVQFAHWELTHTERNAAARIAGTTNAADAAAMASRYYIRPAAVIENMQKRGATAAQLAKQGNAGPVQVADAGNIRTDASPAPRIIDTYATSFGGAAPTPTAVATPAIAPAVTAGAPMTNEQAAAAATAATRPPDYSQSQGSTGTSLATPLALAGAAVLGIAAHRPLTRGIVGVADRMGLTAARDAEIAEARGRVANRDTVLPGATEPAPVGSVPLPPREGDVNRLIPKAGAAYDDMMTQLKTNWRNSDEPLLRLNEALKDTASADPQFKDKVGLRNDMALNSGILEQASNGKSFLTGRTIENQEAYIRAIERAPDASRELAEKAADYANELDRRKLRAAAGMQDTAYDLQGVPTTGTYNAAGVYTPGLMDTINAAQADPIARDLLERRMRTRVDTLEDAVQTGRITRAQQAELLRDRPNFVATLDQNGKSLSPFTQEPGLYDSNRIGSSTRRGSVWSADVQDYANSYKDMARNQVDGDLVKRYHAESQLDPRMSPIFSESKNAQGEWVTPAGPHKVVYTPQGKEIYNVHHPLVARALEGLSPVNSAGLGALSRTAAFTRRTVQSMNTGLGAMINLKAFPMIGNVFNATLAPVTRDSRLIGSYIDLAARKAGLKSGIRLPDPVQVAGAVAHAAVLNPSAVAAKFFASKLAANSNSPFTHTLRGMFGDSAINAVAQRLQHGWENSTFADMVRNRASGGGSHGAVEVSGALSNAGGQVFSPLHALSPTLFPGRVAKQIMRVSNIGGKLVNTLVDTHGLAKELMSAMNEGAQAQMWRMNKGRLSDTELAASVRRMVGDPGVTGAGATSRALATSVPYYNVGVQGLDRLAETIRDHPIGSSIGASALLTMAALAEQYSAMLHGENTTNYLANGIATNQSPRSFNVFHSDDPTHRSEIPVAYEYRALVPFFRELVSHFTGSLQGKPGEPIYERVLNAFHGLFDKHVSQSTATATTHGLGDLVNIIGVPPVFNAAIAAATGGQSADIRLDDMLLNYMQGKPFLSGILHTGGYDRQIPNVPGPSADVTSNDHKALMAIAQNLIGVGADTIRHIGEAYGNYTASDGDMGFALSNFLQSMKQQAADRNPMFGGLWDHSSKLSTNMPLVEQMRTELDRLKPTANAAEQEATTGLTRRMGQPIDVPQGDLKVPTDPKMRAMFMESAKAYDFIQKNYMPQIQDIEKLITAAQNGNMGAEQKRAVINRHTAEIYQWYQKIDDRLEALRQMNSRTAGVEIPRGKLIDWKGTVDQFK